MALTDVKVRNAKPKAKPYKIADGEGLFLLVAPSGSKYWRLKYHYIGKEKLVALGVYPDISLSEARKRRSDAREKLATGIDPSEAKKEKKRLAALSALNTLEAVAREWHENKKHEWASNTADINLARLESHIFQTLGHRPIAEITPSELLAVLRVIEQSGALDTAQRVKQICGKVFMYAIATGRAERNPVPDLRGALKTPVAKNRAFLQATELPDYLEKLDAYNGASLTKLALRFLLLTFVRTTELRAALWSEIDFDKSEWRIPAARMKMNEMHLVPLSTQSVAVLSELKKLTGDGQYLFPNEQNPRTFMSENTMLYALYRMGYHSRATVHGFRSTASTILNESGFVPDVIERQLAHCERNRVRAAYNHAQYLPERRRMMQWWGDYLLAAAKK